MNAATDDPMFFTPTDFFDDLPITSHFASHSNSTIPPQPQQPPSSHHSEKLQYHIYPSSATEWPFQYPLDPPSSKFHYEPLYMSDHPQQQQFGTKQPQPTLGSSIDINPHFAYPSSLGYMDINNTTSWMMNSLDSSTYLPDFSPSLGFYEENQNDENSFHSYHPTHPYMSQGTPPSSSSSSLPSYFMPSSYSQHNLTDLFDSTALSLPDDYVNVNCTESFPNLQQSFTNHQAVGHEVQSFLGYMPREPSPHNTSKILSHSHIDPEPPNSVPDINEGMDDLSDSDTTTSTQSWMMPLPQVPFHSGHDDDLSTPTFQPVGGMVSSISTPVFGLDHSHPHSHLLQQQPSQHGVPTISSRQSMKYKTKKSAKSSTKQQQQDKIHRSNSSHIIHSNGGISRNKTIHNQQNTLKQRVSEPYLLNTIPTFSTTSATNSTIPCPSATKTVPASESIASILSRQRLSDLEEEMENDPFAQSQRQSGLATRRPHPHHQHQKTTSRHKHKPGPRHYFVEGEMDPKSNDSDDNDPTGGHTMQPPPPNQPIKKGRNVDKACNHCKRSHLRCDSMRPCRRCIVTGKSGCQDVEHKPRGRPRLHQT